MLVGLLESDNNNKGTGCPLRRVQLWHTIPLCLLAIINLLLVIVALLGLAGYRAAIGLQGAAFSLAKADVESYAERFVDIDDGHSEARKI